MDHEFQKIHGPWISKNSWTMNFQKSWDIDFQKCLDCDIFLKNFKIFKNFNYVLILIDFVDLVDFVDFVDFLIYCLQSWHLFFLFKVYYSPDNWRERRSITRNFNFNNLNNINIRNKLKVANEIFLVTLSFVYIYVI